MSNGIAASGSPRAWLPVSPEASIERKKWREDSEREGEGRGRE